MDDGRLTVPVRTGTYNGPGANLIVRKVRDEIFIGMQVGNRTVAWAFDDQGKFLGLRAQAMSRRGPDQQSERQQDGQEEDKGPAT